jgi:hypothetical protein
VLLGDQQGPCRGSRASTCPVPGHPCLASVTAQDVVAAVAALVDDAADGDVVPTLRRRIS